MLNTFDFTIGCFIWKRLKKIFGLAEGLNVVTERKEMWSVNGFCFFTYLFSFLKRFVVIETNY
jgi:hypothetical protein